MNVLLPYHRMAAILIMTDTLNKYLTHRPMDIINWLSGFGEDVNIMVIYMAEFSYRYIFSLWSLL